MTIERYRIQHLIGSGGMGAVFRAVHTVLGSHHALKVVRGGGDGVAARLVQEARAQALLHHPNILSVTDILTVASGTVVVMEYIPEGLNLAQLLAQRVLSAAEVDHLGRGMLAGLKAAHQHRLLHRDIKPANVLIRAVDGVQEAVLADFGLVQFLDADPDQRLTQRRLVMGTPGYASPEQLRGHRQLDVRTDVFALGATLYELATGRPAFVGDSVLERCNQTCSGQYVPSATLRPDLPPRMHDAIDSALVVERDRRIGSVDQLLAVWSGVSSHTPVSLVWDGEHPELDLFLQRPNAPRLLAHLQRCIQCRVMLKAHQQHVEQDAAGQDTWDAGPSDSPGDDFIGRLDALSVLHGHLVRDQVRLLTIKGPGGVGKTRLATQVAAQHARSFEGGTFFCDLSAALNPEDIVRGVRDAFSVAQVQSDGGHQVGLVLSSCGRCLIVLDNAEHIIAPLQGLLRSWRQAAPAITWLVTSRVPLQLPGEVVYPLAPMSDDSAVALFQACANRVSGASLPAAEVLDVVRQLDGLPLAIEMAAARLQVFSFAQLRRRLSDRFRVLRSPSSDQRSRHATMFATIDWSWSLLDPVAQQVLAQCSLFRSSFDLDTLESVVVLDASSTPLWVEDILQVLIHSSLIQVVPRLRGPHHFTMLQSIRDYARDRLKQSDTHPAVVQRYIDHHAAFLVIDREPAVDGMPTSFDAVYPQVHRDAFHAAGLALARGQSAAAARCVLYLLRNQPDNQLPPDQAALLHRIQADDIPDGQLRIIFESFRAYYLGRQGQHEEALAIFADLQVRARRQGMSVYEPRLLVFMANVYVQQGRTPEAEQNYLRALQLDQERGARARVAGLHNVVGRLYWKQKRIDEATHHLESALALSRAIGLHHSQMISRTLLGILAVHHGDMEEAFAQLEQALALSRSVHHVFGEGMSLYWLGRFSAKVHRYADSHAYYDDALQIFQKLGAAMRIQDIQIARRRLEQAEGAQRASGGHSPETSAT